MTQPRPVPDIRITQLNEEPVNTQGEYVLYWMIAQRRMEWNFALQRAVEWAYELGKPLLIFEPLRIGYQWASDRHHQFVIEGMRDHFELSGKVGVTYYPYLERSHGEGRGLLNALSEAATVVITDEFPCFFLPRMVRSASQRLSCKMEQVDSCGLLPLRASGRAFTTAASFRRHLQKTLLPYFARDQFPEARPLADRPLLRGAVIPSEILARWPRAEIDQYLSGGLRDLPIDHSVFSTDQGGDQEAQRRLNIFVGERLRRYHSHRNSLDVCAASGLSAHIHFGHISVHQIAQLAFENSGWTPERVAPKPTGSRSGWWGASEAVESFIDELVTWRELGFAFSYHYPDDYDQFDRLPDWALTTLHEHEPDRRPHQYDLYQLEQGLTHDPLWNAAQNQLVREGRIHNYLRMLWGKKVLEWSASPRVALSHLIELNNKYALDGRDPNSYSGIFWCLGRFDRAWGPERPIFGKVRYMSSESTMRKLKARPYQDRYQENEAGLFD